MPLFKQSQNTLKQIKRKKIDLERDIQSLTEDNLELVFGLKLITSEFQLDNLRIDTLAFDTETNSFVIIEYKRNRSFSVVDQGFAYLALLLNNQADFILEYNAKNKNKLSRGDVDWSQSRVVFIAGSFTTHQQRAINFKDLPIELWEVQRYKNNLIQYERIKTPGSSASIKTLGTDQTISRVSKEVKKYSVEDHFKKDWAKSREIFEEIREKILEVDDQIEENPVKNYIGYKIGNSVVVSLNIQKSKVILSLNRVGPNNLQDPEGRVSYVKNSMKYYNKHISHFQIKNTDDIGYAMFLVKQVYKKFIKTK